MSATERRASPVHDLALAVALLTIVPVRVPVREGTSAAAWFPAVGVALGGIIAGVGWVLVELLGASPGTAAAVLVALGALLTRMLHLDGLADVGDAWWGGATPVERRRIMRDSRVGAFATVAVSLALLLQFAALSALLEVGAWWVIVIAALLGRLSATFAAVLGTPAEGSTLGVSVAGPSLPLTVAVGGACVAAAGALAAAVTGVAGVSILLVGVLAAAATPHLVSQRMGGVTGDVMGASVVITESAVLLAAAVVL